jgi:NAD(P)-dependent dehydrogenase (short-subunit alcohol dehydrogenase family)
MTDPLFSVADQVVLVTGGSRGLGRAVCLGLAERGARVVIASRKPDACEELAAQIRGNGGDAFAAACHVGNWESLDRVVADAAGHWGRLDGLINNAGMSPLAPSLLETSETLFDKVIGVNLKGPTRLTALAAEAMKATGGGSIINISSLASVKPIPTAPVYSAAKAGLNALTRAAAHPRQRHHLWHLRHRRRGGIRPKRRLAARDRPDDRDGSGRPSGRDRGRGRISAVGRS